MVVHSLHIAIADGKTEDRDSLLRLLQTLGHDAVAVRTGQELGELCCTSRPDLIITTVHLPDTEGIVACQAAAADRMIPVLLLASCHDEESLEKARHDHVFGFLIKPITELMLVPAIRLAMHRFESLDALRREASELRQALEERKVIEQAKGILTHRLRLEEPEVVCRLRRLATDRCWKIADVARKVLKAEEIFHDIEKANGRLHNGRVAR